MLKSKISGEHKRSFEDLDEDCFSEKEAEQLSDNECMEENIRFPFHQSQMMSLGLQERTLGSALFADSYSGLKEIQVTETHVERSIQGEEEEEVEKSNVVCRRPAWIDETDNKHVFAERRSTLLINKGQHKKLKSQKRKYEDVIESKFTEVYGAEPGWAKLDRPNEEADDEFDFTKRIQQSIRSADSLNALPADRLKFKVQSPLNQHGLDSSIRVSSIEFHRSVPMALVAGTHSKSLGIVSLYQVDGEKNHKVQTKKIPNFPLTCAKFIKNFRSYLVGCDKHTFCLSYDMETGASTKIQWYDRGHDMYMKNFIVSKDDQYVLFYGNAGYLDLFSAKHMSHIQQMHVPSNVNSAVFSNDASRMYFYGDDGYVYMYDVNSRRCMDRFYDDGCVEGTSIAISANNQYLACGSRSGYVNVYTVASMSLPNPRPVKTMDNLTTSIADMCFNSSSEILAVCSRNKKDAVKLLHVPTMTTFKNFPNLTKPFKKSYGLVSFTPNSGYMALGSYEGEARLLRLPYYTSY